MSVYDALHAMMLPSGNDAATMIAENLSQYLTKDNKPCIPTFVAEMNRHAKRMSLQNTRFKNVHGLPDKGNRSTVEDVSKLVVRALKIPVFKEVVGK